MSNDRLKQGVNRRSYSALQYMKCSGGMPKAICASFCWDAEYYTEWSSEATKQSKRRPRSGRTQAVSCRAEPTKQVGEDLDDDWRWLHTVFDWASLDL